MGNSGGKNRTHPSEDGPSPALMDPQYGNIYDTDQHRDYDSGVRKAWRWERRKIEFVLRILSWWLPWSLTRSIIMGVY